MRPILCVALALTASCGLLDSRPAPDLKPASSLEHNCFDPPYTKSNHASIDVTAKKGDRATDFTLKDVKGKKRTLSDMLKEKPVLLLTGSYTCPRYQETQDTTKALASTFADEIHTAAVYVVEAHPKGGPTPYHGKPKPKKYSDRKQQTNYKDRAHSARSMSLGKDVMVLVDELDDDFSNPFWCTYGTCPSCSYLIRQDGTFEAVHEWHDPKTMKQSIEALLKAG